MRLKYLHRVFITLYYYTYTIVPLCKIIQSNMHVQKICEPVKWVKGRQLLKTCDDPDLPSLKVHCVIQMDILAEIKYSFQNNVHVKEKKICTQVSLTV